VTQFGGFMVGLETATRIYLGGGNAIQSDSCLIVAASLVELCLGMVVPPPPTLGGTDFK
jgi:hypothetical protein